MAYTFLRALGYNTGKSLCEEDKLALAKELMDKAKKIKFILPVDVVTADAFPDPIDAPVQAHVRKIDEIADEMGLDIGPQTVKLFREQIAKAGTVIWNGPMGVFENPVFAAGTKEIAAALAQSKCISIIGGGDSAAAVQQMGYGDKVTHISTGGGASLEYLEGKILPGIACLNDKG